MAVDDNKDELIPVSAKALRELLVALNAPDYFVRELQATRNLPVVDGKENPINLLTNQFNDWVDRANSQEG